ncbi:hypothetical protein B7P43_G08843 [Cryptotermes secundus]|uniref:Uncharacterized protein n=1 Tax=Cryptotermes secundus TaxID=105785 RepID=A0A2J7RJD2_9NEOP|nr:hypothetical protein B7P43_G08843 [Cryptotermes secundus]
MSDKGLMNIDSPVTEPSVVNNSVRGNVIVDKPERDLAILSAPDKGCVIGDQDRKLVVLAEEGSSGEMAMIASHAVSDSTDAVNLNEGGASQNTSKINAQNRIGTSRSYDKYPSTSTSAGDGKVGGPVKCDQIIASYQTVMYDHHDRAAARLELRWVPFCCQYSYSCTQQHKSSLWKPSEVCDARSQIMEALMNARQWSCAFHFCCSVTSERSFPSASTVLRILVFILNTHEICLIGSAVSAFKKIVDLHPPCAPDMLRYYTTVLTSTLIENTPCLSDSGIVDGIIYELNDMITFKDLKNEDLPCDSSAVCEDPLVTLNTATEELLDVSAEERAEANKNYATLSHDEKLNRLFIVLEVIVELLEIDLSVFLVKHSFQLRKALIHRSYRPLIVSVLWRTNTVQGIGRLNGICRCIISLYAKCFVHNISFNKWTVIAVSTIGCEHHSLCVGLKHF